jgi:glycosyltransferase involved in cell wall biosynthesis/predicted O-methyltransferase YrrM
MSLFDRVGVWGANLGNYFETTKYFFTFVIMKILYVAPHLSTGGMPQYLYKQVSYFYKDHQIEVVDVTNSGGDSFVVQKNRISSLVPVHTLEEKSELLTIVQKFKPNVIHYQEVPQDFLPLDILNELFKDDREHFNVVTTHSSFTNPDTISHHPDKYVFVSKWSEGQFAHLGLPSDIWEYPIERYEYDREAAREFLGLDPTWKHVLHVGLFTPGKNQGELFAIARQLEKYKIKFHFVGNQAGNFKDYWEPLMKFKPDNCVVWGERHDVDRFYEAMDLFYFPSKFELSPISIKEALSYRLPCMFRRLDTYLDTYDHHPNVKYITEDVALNRNLILEKLHPEFNEIPGWFNYADVYDEMVMKATNGSVFVEVGAWFGKSTNYMASKIAQSDKDILFYAVDTWKGSADEDLHSSIVSKFQGDIFQEFMDNVVLSDNLEHILPIKDTSLNASVLFAPASVDFVMIDAGHSYNDVMADLHTWWRKVKPGGVLAGDDYSVFPGVTEAANKFFCGQMETGFRSFKKRKPKIQAVHLLTKPEHIRERVSVASMNQLSNYGIDYIQIVNKPYTDLPPKEHCRRPEHISMEVKTLGYMLGTITPGHYGCYLAHTDALKNMTDEYDYTLILEADAFLYVGVEEFLDVLYKACFMFEKTDVRHITFSDNPTKHKTAIDDIFVQTGYDQDYAHCYLVANKHKDWWMEQIRDVKWDSADLWYNDVFYFSKKPRFSTHKVYSRQAEGYSLIDRKLKSVQ